MKKVNWDTFNNDEEIITYLRSLSRYRNTAFKSAFSRGKFFFKLLYCRLFKIDKPLFIVLVTNNKCNLKCRYCYGDYGNRTDDKDYSTKELLKLIDELKEIGTQLITMHGGESLLRKDIGEIINYAKHKGFYISFNTNGYLVPNRIADLECLDTMVFSLDGMEESNDKNRGRGCFKKVMEAISIAQQNNIPCVISATLTRDNMQDMEFLAELGLMKNIRIQYSILYNSPVLKDKCSDMVMSDKEIREVVRKILSLKKKGHPIYYSDNVLAAAINWPVPIDEKPYFATKDKAIYKNHKLVYCYHGKLKYQIDADGRVITCWVHDNAHAPNVKELGVAKAIKKCHSDNNCKHCAFLANNEHNALMHLSPRNILNNFFIQVSDAFKIKN
ncbi:MAG: radical SAM protein [Candidatus Omnitrophica bacterium]|jgi:MoaA/NifB/PqqE/SkfB family radical SAM enzyme|nr:radical SAM protein [Candidatus Omnitrophota bacterium]